jgi:hypothetical protein
MNVERTTSTRRLAALMLAAVAALLALAVINPTPAAAGAQVSDYPPATNYRTQVLTATPIDSLPTASVSRTIFLESGNYEWTVDLGTPAECANPFSCPVRASVHIWLIRGWYSWNCYLDPRNGTYREWCTLKTAGYPQASLTAPEFRIPYSGNWTWGGYLFRFSA